MTYGVKVKVKHAWGTDGLCTRGARAGAARRGLAVCPLSGDQPLDRMTIKHFRRRMSTSRVLHSALHSIPRVLKSTLNSTLRVG